MMRWVVIATMLGSALAVPGQAEARGCIKGALVGGIAGHFAGHHGLMGAAAGCAVGHHYANKQPRPAPGDNPPPANPPPAQ